MKKILFVLTFAGVAVSAALATSAGAQENATRNSTVSEFVLAVDEAAVDEVRIALVVEEDGGASFTADNHALGMFARLAGGATAFVGFETLENERWASFAVDYADVGEFEAGNATLVGGGSSFVDTLDMERRVAIPLSWDLGSTYEFVLSRADAATGTNWSASVVSADGTTNLIGSQFTPATTGTWSEAVYSVVQRTNSSSGCNDASYVRATVEEVTSTTANGTNPAFLRRGFVEPESCTGSTITRTGLASVVHELAGADEFLTGPLGTGITIQGEFSAGSAQDATYPYCLANIGELSSRRVCFETLEVRDLNIAAIIASPSRPPGETIWIGGFDEEAVKP